MKQINFLLLFVLISINISFADVNKDFQSWKKGFKKIALKNNISEKTFDIVMTNTKFLSDVIKYDRFQPEFYEDTKTYISKRTSSKKVSVGKNFYYKNTKLIDYIENKFEIEKELLLALMGIETNFGTYVGKMDIVSSLATLSFDKRRSEFFTEELLILLRLVDQKIIDKDILFGSWAGAFGNFQFMPTTISNYAIDYNNNSIIELKEAEDSFASAANYLNKIGWRKNEPCFINIDLNENIPRKLLNTSAKKIKYKKKFKYYKKYIKEFENLNIGDNVKVAVITPDSDIVKNNNKLKPAYLVFSNYDRVLKWNRSLRFAIAVCTLKNKFENEL